MQPDPPKIADSGPSDRRAQIDAAARALRAWIRAREAVQPDASAADAPGAAAGPARPDFGSSILSGSGVPRPLDSARRWLFDFVRGPLLDFARRGLLGFARRLLSRLAAVLRWARTRRWPAIRWSRTASLAAATLVALAAMVWAVAANRALIVGVWSDVVSAGGEVLTPATTGTVVLDSVPEAAQILIGGEEVGTTPLTTELAAGPHVVVFRRGQAVREVEIEVVAGASIGRRIDWDARPTGRLRVDSTPPGATVIIEGRERGVTPLTIEDLPVGIHAMILRSPSGSVERRVTVVADRTTDISEAIYSGFVHVSAPIELVITRGGQRLRLNEQNQLILPPGVHRLRFENARFTFAEERRIDVAPGQTTRVAIVPEPTTLTVTATLPSEVLLNGNRIGETSIVRYALPLGTHEVVVRSLGTRQERRATLTATTAPLTLDVDFSRP